jgi:hypothetical protein
MVHCGMCGIMAIGFGSNDFVTKTQPFPMDGHYRMDIISSVGHPRSDSIVPLVLYMVAVQWLRHGHGTTGPLGQCQSC